MGFLLGILSSIIGTLLVTLIVIVVRLRINGITPLSLCRTFRRITVSKIKYFYNDRKYLTKYLGTTGDFLSSAEVSIMYIGFWMSSSIDNSDILNVLREKTARNVTFSACFPNPNSTLMKYYSAFFSISEAELIMRINKNMNIIQSVRENLPQDKKGNIKIITHEYPISASAYIIDAGTKNCKVLLDHKLPNTERFFSYGFEIYGYNNQFCSNIINSYQKLLNNGNEI